MNQDSQEPFVEFDQDGDKILNVGQLTALQKQYKKEALEQHRLNMTKKQKNFQGRAFIAKPDKIEFKDFTVGKPHYLVITLTNVSNAFNSFNVLPLPPKIRNYFQVQYTPKGKISPGISTDIRFKFLPQLNQDIRSEFTIQAETGNISFPIICSSKKTIVSNYDHFGNVDFGKVIYGEVGRAQLRLVNSGSLPSDLKVQCLRISNVEENMFQESLQQIKFDAMSYIEGNSQKILNFEFIPSKIGVFEADFQVYVSNFVHSPPIKFSVIGTCTEVPVRIEKPVYDFEICLLNHIYRQKLVFYNNGEIPMSFKIVQPNQTKKYFEFNPIIGYIQKQSRIDVWVKFTAEKDLGIYLSKYLTENNLYEIPFQMSVKEQVLPVVFTIKFKITSEKINIKPVELNFGTIFEGLSSRIEITLQNQSDLPQQVLIQPQKKNISLQNDQPLFKILPRQTIRTFITYRTKQLQDNGKSQKEEGTIPCKIITGDIATNEIKIEYCAETLRPDLFIEKNKIELPALQVNEICQVATIFKNNSNKEIIYQLFYPFFQIAGLKITPAVKVLSPKQQVEVNIEYHSAYRKLTAAQLNEIRKKYQKKDIVEEEPKKVEEDVLKKDSKKEPKKEQKLTKQQQQALEAQQKRLEEQERLRKQKQQEQLLQMEKNFDLAKQIEEMGGKFFDFGQTQHYRWLIPIYFKQKEYPDASAQINFIEVTTTAVAKSLVIDKEEIDFGQIAVGSRAVRELSIFNKGERANLKKKQLPIFCCYNLLNSLKPIENNSTFKGVVEFQPIEEQKFQQRLVFYSQKQTVSCLLKGKGVRPEIKVEPENEILNMGAVLLDEFSEKTFIVKNICNFPIEYLIKRIGEGVMNSNSSRAITYIPMNGTIQPNEMAQIKVIFKPDRVNESFFEKIKIHVQQQKEERFMFVTGLCYPRQAYVKHFKELKMPKDQEVKKNMESRFDWLSIKDENKIFGPPNKTICLEFEKMSFESQQNKEQCFKRKLTIGSCKLLDPKNQKPTNFEIVMSVNFCLILQKDDKLFECDNLKGVAAPGTEVGVTFTFKQQELDPFIAKIPVLAGVGQWKESKAELKLSGGFTKPNTVDAISFDIILRAYVNQL